MDVAELLFKEILIERHFTTQIFYVFMFCFMVGVLLLAWRYRLLRFSLLLWLGAGIIGLLWEVALFSSGLRFYSFFAALELMYHALTEGGPGLILMAIFADRFGIIDLAEYKEEERK